jgi:hypothetical protein
MYTVFKVQSGIFFKDCRENIVDNSQVMAWLSFEVFAFYLNIMSMGVFLLLSSIKKFRSIRDRVGLLVEDRRSQDFLVYCSEDLHWFSMWFTQVMLTVLTLVMRIRNHEQIQWTVGVLVARFILEIFVMRQVYFSSTFEVRSFSRIVLMIIFGLNCYLLKIYLGLDEKYLVWWAPCLLQDIVIHFYVFVQILFEWANWDKTVHEWKKEIAFVQQLKQQDYEGDEK